MAAACSFRRLSSSDTHFPAVGTPSLEWQALEQQAKDLIAKIRSPFEVDALPDLIVETTLLIEALCSDQNSDAPEDLKDSYIRTLRHSVEAMKVKDLSIRLYDRHSPTHLPEDLIRVSELLLGGHRFIHSRRRLGEGCFGVVYAVKLDTTCIAEKTVIPGHDTPFHDPEKLKREAALLMALAHKNIVSVLGFNQEPRVALMLETAARGSLYDNLTSRDLYAHHTICHILGGIVSGLSYMHKQELTHCDLHWGNVGLTEDLTPRILDFELASLQTPSHAANGNILIQSPEAMRTQDEAHHRACRHLRFQRSFPHVSEKYGKRCYFYSDLTYQTDIWSFGMLAFSLLSGGHTPYELMHISMRNYLLKTVFFSQLSYLQKALMIPRKSISLGLAPADPLSSRLLKEVVLPCFARNPKERPSAEDLSIRLLDLEMHQQRSFCPITSPLFV